MDTVKDNAPEPHPSTDESPHICLEGVVYIGHLVEEDGEEVEIFEAVPCRRCADSRADSAGA